MKNIDRQFNDKYRNKNDMDDNRRTEVRWTPNARSTDHSTTTSTSHTSSSLDSAQVLYSHTQQPSSKYPSRHLPCGGHSDKSVSTGTQSDKTDFIKKHPDYVRISKINSIVIPVGLSPWDIPEWFGPGVPTGARHILVKIISMLENEDDDLDADILFELVAEIDNSVTFEEVWTIADYLLSVGDINFDTFLYAISVNTPRVAQRFRATFNDWQWDVFNSIRNYLFSEPVEKTPTKENELKRKKGIKQAAKSRAKSLANDDSPYARPCTYLSIEPVGHTPRQRPSRTYLLYPETAYDIYQSGKAPLTRLDTWQRLSFRSLPCNSSTDDLEEKDDSEHLSDKQIGPQFEYTVAVQTSLISLPPSRCLVSTSDVWTDTLERIASNKDQQEFSVRLFRGHVVSDKSTADQSKKRPSSTSMSVSLPKLDVGNLDRRRRHNSTLTMRNMKHAEPIIITKVSDFVIPVGINLKDIPECFGPDVPIEEQNVLIQISQFLERKNIEVDTLHQLLLKVNRLITFDEVWTIADYMIQGGDSKIDFNQFMYAISVNTPTVAHIYRTTFTDRQWEVFTAISRFIRMHKWITPLQRLTKLIESTSREVRWREHLYEKRTLTPTSTRSKRYWAKSMKLNKLWPFSRVSRYYKKFALPSLTSRPKKSILKRKTNVTQEMGAVFVPSSETGFSGMNFTSSESSSEEDYAPRLAVRGICNSRKAVSLPKLKIRRNLAGLDPETLRSKRRNDVMLYTDQVREFYAKQSLKCWNGMRVHDIQSPILQERFQEIYASYMPCRKEDVFVRAPYTPPPLSMAYLTALRRIIDHPTMLLSKPVRRRNARTESVLFSATDGFTPLSRDRS